MTIFVAYFVSLSVSHFITLPTFQFARRDCTTIEDSYSYAGNVSCTCLGRQGASSPLNGAIGAEVLGSFYKDNTPQGIRLWQGAELSITPCLAPDFGREFDDIVVTGIGSCVMSVVGPQFMRSSCKNIVLLLTGKLWRQKLPGIIILIF